MISNPPPPPPPVLLPSPGYLFPEQTPLEKQIILKRTFNGAQGTGEKSYSEILVLGHLAQEKEEKRAPLSLSKEPSIRLSFAAEFKGPDGDPKGTKGSMTMVLVLP